MSVGKSELAIFQYRRTPLCLALACSVMVLLVELSDHIVRMKGIGARDHISLLKASVDKADSNDRIWIHSTGILVALKCCRILIDIGIVAIFARLCARPSLSYPDRIRLSIPDFALCTQKASLCVCSPGMEIGMRQIDIVKVIVTFAGGEGR